jgi:hypothetical protein
VSPWRNLARPGGNLTGINFFNAVISNHPLAYLGKPSAGQSWRALIRDCLLTRLCEGQKATALLLFITGAGRLSLDRLPARR